MADEERLWTDLAADFRQRGEARTGKLALEQVAQVDADRERLEKLLAEVRELGRPE
jgi:hypothetical protein